MSNDKNQDKIPAQHQDTQPGLESHMNPLPEFEQPNYKASSKLLDKVAVITGGDSGIGRSVSVLYAKEGADVAIIYFNEHNDAIQTQKLVEQEGRKCLLISGDIGDESFCKQAIERIIKAFGKIDIVVNNAAEQHPQESLEDITQEQLERTFKTNIFGFFYITKYALKYLKSGSTIINTTSVTSYKGSPQLLDYSATKGAIRAFTYSLSMNLAEKGIRVNGVAPGPIWTPLIPSTFPEDKVATFGKDVPMGRPGQPDEVATSFVFLASEDASYITGQILHPNGGTIING